jgi:hypothetical protein
VIQAIPTIFDGIEFRSRLEARWAAMFHQLGWDWIYEPFDGNGYIPDFLVHGPRPLLVEVKPAVTADDYEAPWAKINDGLRDDWRGGVLVVGVDPLPKCMWDSEFFPNIAGLIVPGPTLAHCDTCWNDEWDKDHGERDDATWDKLTQTACSHWRWWWRPGSSSSAMWVGSGSDPTMTRVFAESCHQYRGPNLFGGSTFDDYCGQDPAYIKQAWATACNEVKWRGRYA